MRQFVKHLAVCLISTCHALTLHEQIADVPTGWERTDSPSGNTSIVLQIALVKQNLDQLDGHLQAVSTPNSAGYGKYLGDDDVAALFPVSDKSKTAVQDWLQEAGVTESNLQGDSIWIKTDVAKANSLLGTSFQAYTDKSTGVSKVRTLQYWLPDHLVQHVDLIAPTTYFGASATGPKIQEWGAPQKISKRSAVPAACQESIQVADRTYASFGPDCLKIVYGINDYTPLGKGLSRVGFGSFVNQSASFSDFTQFQKYYNIPVQNFTVELVNPQDGATALPQPPLDENDDEANLDVQYLGGISHPLPITEFITAGSPPFFPDPVEPTDQSEPYLPYFEYLLSKPNSQLPQVISNSYGDDEQTVPQRYAERVCNLIGILGLRGTSVLEASGDQGVGAACLSQDGKTPQFNPTFPATCPYVTAVGGTVGFAPEQAWKGSSGGFSYFFGRPWYQQQAVSSYLNNHVSPSTKQYYSKYTNFNGRGFPDVAAHSISPHYTVIRGGRVLPSGGTSAAAPVTAAIVALLNDARLRHGKPALGFLNPLIYLIGNNGFTDITSGSSIGCNGRDTLSGAALPPGASVIPGSMWNATAGWDPVTGFGTPDFQKLLKLALRV